MIPTEQERDRLANDPSAGASVVYDRGLIVVGPGFKFTFERHRRVQIFRTDGYRFANVEIPFHSSEKLEKVEAHTLTKDGRRIPVEQSAFYRTQTGEWQKVAFAFPEVAPGCVVEYKYTIFSRSFYYLRPWVFQNEAPTEFSELVVRLPEGFEYVAVLNNKEFVEGPDSTIFASVLHRNQNVRQFIWHAHNLPPLVPEPLIASLLNHRVRLDFQIVRYVEENFTKEFVDSWTDLAGQVRRVYAPRLHPGATWRPWGKLPADGSAGAAHSRRELAKRIYEFVRDSIAQFGNALSVYDPDLLPASTVMAQRCGNPVEKNLLLVALLRDNGFSAWPVLISRRSHLRFDIRDHRLEQFDHVIALLSLNGDDLFCETNVPGAWMGYLPPDDQVDAGVVIDRRESDRVVVELPAPPVDKDVFADGTVYLAPDGSATGHLEITVLGQAAYELVCALADHDTVGYLHKEWLPDIVPVSMTVTRDPDDDWAPVRLSVDFSWPNAATVDGQRLFVRPAALRQLDENPLMATQRRYPISFDALWSEDCRIVWHYPVGYRFADLPAPREMSGDGYEFRASVLAEGNTVVASRFWRVGKRDFAPGRFAELRDLFNTVQLAQRGLVVFYRETP